MTAPRIATHRAATLHNATQRIASHRAFVYGTEFNRGHTDVKRGTIHHPKTAALAMKLELSRWGAVGLLESLWHFTSEYAKQGDIGRFSDDQIAAAIDWQGDSAQLVRALVDTHWCDECAQCRLRVHDWAQHCDDGVHTVLARAGLLFADGTEPNLRRLSLSDRRKLRKKLDARVHDEHINVRAERTASGKKHSSPSPSPSPAPAIAMAPAQPEPEPKPAPAVRAEPQPEHGSGGSGPNGAEPGPGAEGSGSGPGSRGVGLEMQRQLAALRSVDDSEEEITRFGGVQRKLNEVGVNADVVGQLAHRRDVTPARIDRELADIRGSPKPVVDVAAVLVTRLRTVNGHAKARRKQR